MLNHHIRRIIEKLSLPKRLLSTVLAATFLLLVAADFSGLANPDSSILVLICILFGVRLLCREEPAVKVSSSRRNGKSIVFSDEKKRRFVALSIVEVKTNEAARFRNIGLGDRHAKTLKATRVLAEHVGTYSIEVEARPASTRFLTRCNAGTAVEACQRAEASAERMLRIVRELCSENFQMGILEGEQLQNAFLSIVGGDFESLTSVGNVVLCGNRRDGAVSGFALLKAVDGSIGMIDLERLISVIQGLDTHVTYIVNVNAHRTYNDDVLIDGVERGQKWGISSYFIVNGRGVETINEAARRLKDTIENITREGILSIERGSSVIDKIGSIMIRSTIGKKLALSNDQLINHIYTMFN